jgi:uncharacterized protein YlxP (DUF503 family)
VIVAALKLTFASGTNARRIKDRLWSRYKISLAELPTSSPLELAIGAALVGSDERSLSQRVQQIVSHVQDWGAYDLIDHEVEFLHFEDFQEERNLEKYDP